jgi:hypothetical protein
MSRKLLQVSIFILTLLPLVFGLLGLAGGIARFSPGAPNISADLDSQYRFLSGLYLGIAVLGWWLIPRIEKEATIFRILCAAIFTGGIGRILSWFALGEPGGRFQIVLIAELLFPLLSVWQWTLVRKNQIE